MEQTEECTNQISLVVFHPRCADQVILLSPPVSKPAEKVVGEEAVNGVPDDVNVDRLLHPEPEEHSRVYRYCR